MLGLSPRAPFSVGRRAPTASLEARVLLLLAALLPACAGPGDDTADPLAGLVLVQEDPSDAPFRDLSAEWMERFDLGDVAFEAPFRSSQGLGPAYIRSSCASCHADDARGPGMVTKMVVLDDPEAESELLPWGNTERPYVAGGATTPLVRPDDPRVEISTRAPPAVFGRGYLEAIDEAEVRALASSQAEAGRVSGRVNEVVCNFEANDESLFPTCSTGATVMGRFGLKARVPTLDGFAADAYQGDMSITSPMRPDELANPDGLLDDDRAGVDIDLETVNVTGDYMRLLDIPPREPLEEEGAALFADLGCADCHTPSLRTRADWPVPQLAGIDAPIYSDLLLHDMGEGFSDGLSDGGALPSEWRTSPLIGLRHLRYYLHDGRADSVDAAIVAHGGAGSEALFSADLYAHASPADRETLLRYVESL
ncbi:MAG: di-heme oxidoredictase family protein [Pseudomonadota bacterium]|nr:di-heme oxidoredictase family protein [Pseudomonadota bacterium]